MSAGSLPKLTKTEPWELIQAFAEAQNQAAAQANAIHAQQQMEAMKEAGADRRMERAHALGLDKLKQELAIKTPYEIAAEQRQQAMQLGLIGAKGEEGRKDITLQGEQNRETHKSNKTFDVDADIGYKRKELEISEPYKEREGERLLDRQQRMDRFRTDENIRQERETAPIKEGAEVRKEEREQTALERRAELEYKYRQRGATEEQARRLAEQDAAASRQKEATRFTTDEAIRKEKELEDTRIARERAKQGAITDRQRSALDVRSENALELQRRKDEAALQRTNLSNEAKAEQIRLRAQLRQISPRFAVPPGYILHDPEKFIEEDRLKLNDPNQYEKLGVYQDPTRPGKNFEVYRPKTSTTIVPPTTSATPNAGVATPPAARQTPVAPNADTGIPAGKLPPPNRDPGLPNNNTPLPRRYEQPLDSPPASTTPAPPATTGQTPTPPPDTDWLRRSPETERPASTGKGDRRGEVEYPEGARAQYASLGGDDDLSQFRDQRGVTNAPKDQMLRSDRSIANYDKPVSTEGRKVNPSRAGVWSKTLSDLSQARPDFAKWTDQAARRYGLNPDMLAAQQWQENKWRVRGRSSAGAQGYAQFIPDTARRYGVDVNSVQSSINGQAHYMSDIMKRFNGNVGLALAGYNWGEGGPRTNRGVYAWLHNKGADPARMPKETRNYVQSITGRPIEFWAQKYFADLKGGRRGAPADVGRLQDDTVSRSAPMRSAPARQLPSDEQVSSFAKNYQAPVRRDEIPLPPRRPEEVPLPPRRPRISRTDDPDLFYVDV